MIRKALIGDANALAEIYNYYVENTIITFDEVKVNASFFEDKISRISKKFPFLVYVVRDKVVGYAYLDSWKNRCAYRNSAEISVYIDYSYTKKGIGSLFYKELIVWLQDNNFHSVVGGIALPNEKSIALHEKFGFEKAAHFKEIGYKFNKRIDVGYWQRIL